MSQLTTCSPSADRVEILELLKRVAKNLKKSGLGQKLAVYQDEIARSYGYTNWSMLHKNVVKMTQSQLAAFTALVVQDVDVRKILLTQPEFVEAYMIKCTLFSKNIGYVAREFKDGDAQAIVLSDSNKIKAAMESNDAYYYNTAKVKMRKEMLKKGFFEVPLVSLRGNVLNWIEGFHQVNAAIEEGLTVVPIGTSLALAQQLKSLVGVSNPDTIVDPYDFSECEATVV